MKTISEVYGDSPRTPTLRQYWETHGSAPIASHVTHLFTNGKFGNWGIVTEHGFKVNFPSTSVLAGVIESNLGTWEKKGTPLVVNVVDGKSGRWQLALDEVHVVVWEAKPWGFILTRLRKPPSPHGKTTAPSGERARAQSPEDDG